MSEELANLRAVANDEVIQETMAALETTREKLDEYEAELEALRAEREQLVERKNELEALAEGFEDDRASLDELTAERDILREQLEELEEKLASGADAINVAERMKADKAALEATLADLILENDRLEDALRKK